MMNEGCFPCFVAPEHMRFLIMDNQYVEKRETGYWLRDTRISLDSVILAFLQGLSPEAIAAECFPTLSLEQVYGAIAYYLANRSEIDAYLKASDAEFQALHDALHGVDAKFSEKLTAARRSMQTVDS
jgi:uncharacterized protein (DUF433 family)